MFIGNNQYNFTTADSRRAEWQIRAFKKVMFDYPNVVNTVCQNLGETERVVIRHDGVYLVQGVPQRNIYPFIFFNKNTMEMQQDDAIILETPENHEGYHPHHIPQRYRRNNNNNNNNLSQFSGRLTPPSPQRFIAPTPIPSSQPEFDENY
jgi:hypothetical protein